MPLSTTHDKRGRRTRNAVEQLDSQILADLAADHPQSVRHIFYRMTDPRLPEPVEKSDRGYRAVQYRCTVLRRAGRLPYGYITDATRRGYFTDTFGGPSDFLRRVAGLYRADLWQLAEAYVEVWCESRSIAGVIQGECERLAVSLYPAAGFSSITMTYEAAEAINIAAARKPAGAVIYYIGDYDPAGVLIDVSIEREIRQHLDPSIPLEFVRLGITEAQIAALDLPTKPRKAGDKRSAHVASTVEAEAMPAHVLRELLRAAVESHLPAGALDAAMVAEESEREHLERWAALMEEAA